MPNALYPSFNGSPPGPESLNGHKNGVELNSPLGDFAAQASSEIARGPKSIGKRKLRASDGPKTLENVSSNHSWPLPRPPRVLPWLPGLSQGPPDAIPEPSRAFPAPSRASPGVLRQPPACLVPSTNKEWQASSRQLAAPSLQSPSTGVPGLGPLTL